MRTPFLLLLLLALFFCAAAAGQWRVGTDANPPYTCTHSHVCYKLLNATEPACRALNAKRILFCGDSYVRHAYEGLALLLSGDYETGVIKNDPACAGEAQFEEKDCRHKVPMHFDICGVRIELRYDAWCEVNANDHMYDWIVWGFGNHPVHGDYATRHGVYDVQAVVSEKLDRLCADSIPAFAEKIIVLNNHCRLDNAHMQKDCPDSTNERVQYFNDEIELYMRHRCNITHFIDTFAMTSELIRIEPAPGKLTHDGVHWGRIVNVVKAWMLVHMMMAGGQRRVS